MTYISTKGRAFITLLHSLSHKARAELSTDSLTPRSIGEERRGGCGYAILYHCAIPPFASWHHPLIYNIPVPLYTHLYNSPRPGNRTRGPEPDRDRKQHFLTPYNKNWEPLDFRNKKKIIFPMNITENIY